MMENVGSLKIKRIHIKVKPAEDFNKASQKSVGSMGDGKKTFDCRKYAEHIFKMSAN